MPLSPIEPVAGETVLRITTTMFNRLRGFVSPDGSLNAVIRADDGHEKRTLCLLATMGITIESKGGAFKLTQRGKDVLKALRETNAVRFFLGPHLRIERIP